MKKIILTFFVLTVIISCDKPVFYKQKKGTFVESGSPCGEWKIDIGTDEQEFLQPNNLDDFDIEPKVGMEVKVRYNVNDGPSICNQQTIDVRWIKEL